MSETLIGIDDTDNHESPGTGQLSRRLAAELGRRGIRSLGITRHQFLLDDRIPYSSHNSGACLAVTCDPSAEELNIAASLIREWSAPGSDPGICIAATGAVPPAVIEWGWRATREVLTISEALAAARDAGLRLEMLGGTGQGVIGALGSVGLRADGNEGRFLDLAGLRSLGERVRIEELDALGVRVEHSSAGKRTEAGGGNGVYFTAGWVRPRLQGGRAVWPVEWSDEHDAWIGIDRKKSRPLE